MFYFVLHLDSSSEVNDLDRQKIIEILIGDLIKEDDILGLEVSVNDVEGVDVGESSKDLLHYLSHYLLRLLGDFVQRISYAPPFAVFHYHVKTIFVL
jgi:hypothetical protein